MLDRISRLQAIAGAGDAILLLAFAAIGRSSHNARSGGAVLGTIGTALPFLVGWCVAAPPLGAFAPAALSDRRTAVIWVARSWLVADAIALGIRSLLEGRLAPPTFVAITLAFNLVTLATWRAALAGVVWPRVHRP